jgi:hypothetical protein
MPNRNSNPFSCRYFEPGNIPFLFHNEHSIESLACKLQSSSRQRPTVRRWAIVGPHGSGKSTLIKQLSEQLEARCVWSMAMNSFPIGHVYGSEPTAGLNGSHCASQRTVAPGHLTCSGKQGSTRKSSSTCLIAFWEAMIQP